ncbi:protein KRI1 homolog [Esox lucius]|uniref:Protein KRI1 homolog n=1 Tax=Esox lucius TaxID=8010 RepID=A0A3P8XYR4_ESOLU|nr:protein KRI1 homolog [Esox lucius]
MSSKTELKINSKFADKYEKYRQKEELQRLKDKYGDQADESESGSESDEDDDDSEVELDPKLERDFYRTLSLLKKKDPKIYQSDAKFFIEEDVSIGNAQPSTSKITQKPMYLKDYERKVILERAGKYEEEESDEEAAMRERAASPSYIQEQRELKESFRKFIQDSDEEGSVKEDDDSQLLKRRTKTQEEKDKEDEDYVNWLKGQAELESPEELQDMKYLRDYWNDPELDEKERFLRDFVLNKGYIDKDAEDRIPSYDEVVNELDDSEEDGESFLERQEDFERHYNFRFEEPDAQKIKTYPRTIATSVRSKDERRKLKREEVKNRKKKEKEQKHEQLKQLKNLKRSEIMAKLKQLQELTGNEQLAFSQVDLDGDFDPQQHDQLMQKFFGDEYYGEEEGEKPQFDVEVEDEHWNWDTWRGQVGVEEYDGEEEQNGVEYEQPTCEDPDFIMDADYDPSQPTTSKKQKKKEKKKNKQDALIMGKKKKKSHFAEVITQNKPVFDPKEKSFEQYLDEYYKLDYEDIIDDIPCRFRYRQVLANDFGLSTDEILGADEKELNRWVSLKKTCMFRSDKEEMCDLQNYKIKARNMEKKRQILNSFYLEEDKEQPEGKNKVGKKRRDRMKNSVKDVTTGETELSQESSALNSTGVDHVLIEAGDQADEEDFLVPKAKKIKLEETVSTTQEMANSRTEKLKLPKKKHRQPGSHLMSGKGPFRVKMGGREFSGQRLRAYGLNPKRLHFRQLGRQKRKAQEKAEKKARKK